MWAVWECVWVTLGLHLSGTRIDPRVWTQAHKSSQILSFLLVLFPSSSECPYSISVSILSTMTVPIHPPSQTFHTESNATSLGHFILIAKHSNLVRNTHTHTHRVRCPHMVLSLKSNREARGSEVRSETQLLYDKSATQNLPLAQHRTVRWFFETLTSCLFYMGSSVSFLFLTFPPSNRNLSPLRSFFSFLFYSPSTTTWPASLMLSAHHFHMQLFQWLDHTLLLED